MNTPTDNPRSTAEIEARALRRARNALVACRGCDRIYLREPLAAGERARCLRCNEVLYTHKPHTVDRSLAAALSGIVLLLASLFLPFLTLTRNGIESSMTVIDAIEALWGGGMRWLGLLMLAMIVILPLLRLLLLSVVLLHVRELERGEVAKRWPSRLLRLEILLEPWAMADVFMVGVVVSMVKIGTMARLELGPAFWALIGLVISSAILSIYFCRDSLWLRLGEGRVGKVRTSGAGRR